MKTLVPALLLLLLVGSACGVTAGEDAENVYAGKVVDGETGQPMEGAVVLGIYGILDMKYGVDKYVDAKETVTDKDGQFSFHGRVLIPMDLSVLVVKEGYAMVGMYFWNRASEKLWDERSFVTQRGKLTWVDKKPVIGLWRPTLEEASKYRISAYCPNAVPARKRKRFTEEMGKLTKREYGAHGFDCDHFGPAPMF